MADLPRILERTLAPNRDVIQRAEQELKQAANQPGHDLAILQLISTDSTPLPIRQAAAIHFKNRVRYHWETFLVNDKDTIRKHVVDLMCTVPSRIQDLISESIAWIAKSDYPDHWQSLLPDIVSKFGTDDMSVLNGLLKTANSIFKAFRHVERSDELYRVIIQTLNGIQEPISMLFAKLSTEVKAKPEEMKLENLRLICRIYFSLNFQDLPEYFEDHLKSWMGEFASFLAITNGGADPEDAPNALDKLQSAILSILDHYVLRDEEPFMEYLPTFTKLVWELLNGASPRHDTITVTSIQFLASLIEKPMHSHLFQSPETLKLILLQIVIPNLAFRDSDMEKFEDDPADFMLTEVEGSNSESRRRKAQICLKALCKSFNETTVALVQEHVAKLLSEYATAPDAQWAKKDVAIHLIMGVAIKKETIAWGVSEVNANVNVLEFFQQQIIPELQDTSANRPVVKAAAIKFVATFRFQFSREQLIEMIKLLIPFYKSPVVVIHTYAAYATERILFTRESMTGEGLSIRRVKNTDLAPIVEAVFNGLFAIAEQIDERENEYAMRAIMRALSTADRDILPVYQTFLERLTNLVARIAKNPRNPNFNHSLFDSIACIVRTVCVSDGNAVSAVENLLFPTFMVILQQQVADFTPYVFQLLAQILEFRPTGLGEMFSNLFAPLLSVELWSQHGNVPALTRLVKAYIAKSPQDLVQHLTPLLGIFQKLMMASSTEGYAFSLLRCIISSFPQESYQQHYGNIFKVMLTTIQVTPGVKPRKTGPTVAFFSFFVAKIGPNVFMETLGKMGNDLGMSVITQVWAKNLVESKQSQPLVAKEHVLGVTRLLTEVPQFVPAHREAWIDLFFAVTEIVSSRIYSKLSGGGPAATADVPVVYDNTFSQLSFAKTPETDYFREVDDPRKVFCSTLQGFLNQHGDMYPVPGVTNPNELALVQKVFQDVGFPLSS